MEERLKDLYFTVTDEMEDMLLQMIVIRQLIDNDSSTINKRYLNGYYKSISKYFMDELYKNNIDEIKKYNSIISSEIRICN